MLVEARFGRRRWIGIWRLRSFNAHAGTGRLAFAARPQVFPLPLPMPRPTRCGVYGRLSLSLISFSILFHHFHEMFHRINHAATEGVSSSVLWDALSARPMRGTLVVLRPDRAPLLSVSFALLRAAFATTLALVKTASAFVSFPHD